MDLCPDPDHEAIAEAVDAVCARFDDAYWSGLDQRHEFPWDFYRAMAEGGWVGICIPEQYGGGGQGIAEGAIVLNRVAASGACMNGSTALHLTMFGLNPVVRFGNDRLKEAFLPRAAAGDLHVAFGVTEPDAGTDTSRIATRAVDDGQRRVRGVRAQDLDVQGARVRGLPAAGPHRRRARQPSTGCRSSSSTSTRPTATSPRSPRSGRNAVASCEVAYDDLPVEGWRLVGERGQGFRHILHGLNPERILLAAMACGIGEAALRRAVAYAGEREVFGRPIGANQAIAHPLAQAHMQLAGGDGGHARRRLALRPRPARAASRPTPRSTSPPRPAGSPPTRPCRPTAASATPPSTTSSATGARPGCSGSPR